MTSPEWPTTWAQDRPDHPAVIDVRDGTTLTHGELERRSRAVAHWLWDSGLRPGDHVAGALANRVEFFVWSWAAHRIGLYWTAINTHLAPEEARHVAHDCEARVLAVDAGLPELADALGTGLPRVERRVAVGGSRPGHDDLEALSDRDTGELPHEGEGERMLYTSGTTGTPKGVERPLTDGPPGSVFLIRPLMMRLGFGADSVLMNPAPLYHSAPSGYGFGVHRLGGTVLISGRFDPAACLQAMQDHRATHGLFVPTHFSRMLRVPDRERYDLSSLRVAAHGAAPCPESVKQAMLDWWGPKIVEYYGGTEGAGMTWLEPDEWRTHPGSVGRPVVGSVHIVDEDSGAELGPGETGGVYFSGGSAFRYHGDDAKTAAAYDMHGRSTLGDIGHVDDDGYLYLTDRRSFTVISGGVNVYPQEAENVLAGHPLVADVAAFGVPDDDLGEVLIAVVEPAREPGPGAAEEILGWCRQRLTVQKCPRRIEFRATLPRAENGKLYKRSLRDEYARQRGSSEA